MLVTNDSPLRQLALDFNKLFVADYDSQGVEEGTTSTMETWRDEDFVVVLIPSSDRSDYAGALGFDLGVDNWWLDWAYLQPTERHLGLVTTWWPRVLELLYEHGHPWISNGAESIHIQGPMSPSGQSLVRRLGLE